MWVAGIDIGSVTSKGVLYNGEEFLSVYQPTGFQPKTVGERILDQLCSQHHVSRTKISAVYGTGYGRIHFPAADEVLSEITCQGRGCNLLFPEVNGILDIGGQDSKAMRIDGKGKVLDFALNDKCAAGTGRFLEMSVNALGMTLDDLDVMAAGCEPVEIGSMCSVFCESEVLSLMMQGEEKGRIVAGLLKSIATRVMTMVQKVAESDEIVFTGGIAQSRVLREFLEEFGRVKVYTPKEPLITAALGAAVIGYGRNLKKERAGI